MKEKFRKYWDGKVDPMHRFDTTEHLKDYADELHLLFRRETVRSVLDIGCGTGSLYTGLGFDKADRYKGVDFSQSMLDQFAKDHPSVDLECAEGSAYSDGQKYDLIFSNSVVQNFDASMLQHHLENAKSMLADGGTLVVASNPWRAVRHAYLSGEAGAFPDTANGLKGMLRFVKHGGRAFGRWLSMAELHKKGKALGFEATFYGSLHYPYRYHAKLKPVG